MATARPAIKQKSLARGIRKELNHNWDLYLLILPVVLYFIIFCYYPMYGAQIAFRDYRATRGILGSEWVGLEHFRRFFTGAYVGRLFKNTFLISLYSLVFGFPMPIILAIMLNEIRCVWFKKTVQLVTYAPFFLSTVVMVGLPHKLPFAKRRPDKPNNKTIWRRTHQLHDGTVDVQDHIRSLRHMAGHGIWLNSLSGGACRHRYGAL